ncbi:hypothetical protein [Caulobacter sp. BP25]|uniref:hypothetical protein n=1 Tax=Caulobacter sp. BP25 TaxID=2048900 RepID=UPI000C12DBB4|nr:hypothetical protein [Caulobacter sp. BP25]PHY18483.1 hypothetical protein CSW59_17275 [Caulobacter sp. BP25]
MQGIGGERAKLAGLGGLSALKPMPAPRMGSMDAIRKSVGKTRPTLGNQSSVTVWFDPSDLSSMWIDSARTQKAQINQPVGSFRNKGTAGGYVFAPSEAARPVLRYLPEKDIYYLEVTQNSSQLSFESTVWNAFVGVRYSLQWAARFRSSGTIFGGGGIEHDTGWNLHTGFGSIGDLVFGTFGDNLGSPITGLLDLDVVAAFQQTNSGRTARANGVPAGSDTSTLLFSGNAGLNFFVGPLSGTSGQLHRFYGMVMRVGDNIAPAIRNADEQYLAALAGAKFTST